MNIHRLLEPILKITRKARMQLFESLLSPEGGTTVLDVGGTAFNWQFARTRPRVVLLNLDFHLVGELPKGFSGVIADGRHLPFRAGSFDVVFCNSVIEHVPVGSARTELAAEIRRVGKRYFVQTPNRGFPIEPHFYTPLFQFLPKGMRRLLARNFTPWGWITRPAKTQAVAMVDEIELLAADELQKLFPDSTIAVESFAGMKKSLVAYRG